MQGEIMGVIMITECKDAQMTCSEQHCQRRARIALHPGLPMWETQSDLFHQNGKELGSLGRSLGYF